MSWSRWSVNWHGRLQGQNNILPLFKTRKECREYIRKRYGYIRTRKDLRSPPHNWKMPKPVKVNITMDLGDV